MYYIFKNKNKIDLPKLNSDFDQERIPKVWVSGGFILYEWFSVVLNRMFSFYEAFIF